ncbi:glutamine-hydrolyzing carbamoyl-phosphate synthase small subunit [Oligoflexia bacterium]|nr:glutamine-hydrolyzing carbamoyl-phosphate synthase small subunit [Oligoflexia bacterium]
MKKKIRETAILALADGTVFKGQAFGARRGVENAVTGEVVFNTSMFGYQEILTDPSYAGQIMTFTYPHIGNVGCNEDDIESDNVHVEGIIIRNLSRVVSNFRATKSLEQYLMEADVMGLCKIDTRSLVMHIRDQGAQMGSLACGSNVSVDDLIDIAKAQGSMEGKDYVQHVTCKKPYVRNELPWTLQKNGHTQLSQEKIWSRPHVVALDCGIKFNILRLLLDTGFRVTVVPATHTSAEILELKPDALFLSNGPGDPATLNYCVNTVKDLIGRFPIFGICLGLQILGQVVGGKTYKLKFGHRGANHPVMDLTTSKVEITVQNHGFAVDADSLPANVKVSHLNLNDNTVEGIEIPDQLAFAVQYHPEASGGPHDAKYLFRRFFEMVVGYQESNGKVVNM